MEFRRVRALRGPNVWARVPVLEAWVELGEQDGPSDRFPGLADTPLVLKRPTPTPPEVMAHALDPDDVARACLFVATLPPRAHVPELILLPSRL